MILGIKQFSAEFLCLAMVCLFAPCLHCFLRFKLHNRRALPVLRSECFDRDEAGRAEGKVVHRTKRVVFCSGELYDAAGEHLASARCTQVLRSRR